MKFIFCRFPTRYPIGVFYDRSVFYHYKLNELNDHKYMLGCYTAIIMNSQNQITHHIDSDNFDDFMKRYGILF